MNEINLDLIRLNKIATGNYTDYNSWERPKKEPCLIGYRANQKQANLCTEQHRLNLTNADASNKSNSINKNAGKSKARKADKFIVELTDILNPISDSRGRKMLEKDKNPKDRLSRKFFSEEKYHYSQNLEIEQELKHFKREIEARFK